MILSSTSVTLSTCQACTPKYSRNARSMMSTVTYVLAKQTHVRETHQQVAMDGLNRTEHAPSGRRRRLSARKYTWGRGQTSTTVVQEFCLGGGS